MRSLFVSVRRFGACRRSTKEYEALDRVLQFYGQEGVDNGVDVVFDESIGRPGLAKYDEDEDRVTITLNLTGAGGMKERFQGQNGSNADVEASAVVAHEGQHGVDFKNGVRDVLRLEINAYTTQTYVNEGFKSPSAWGVSVGTSCGIRGSPR